MQARRTERGWFLRLERGEELVESLAVFLDEQDIRFGCLRGIGAVDRAELGLYSLKEGKYHRRLFEGEYELAGLQGNVSTVDGLPFPHLHALISDSDYHVRGGHLFAGRVSATCEIDLVVYEGEVPRLEDAETGLKLMDLGG